MSAALPVLRIQIRGIPAVRDRLEQSVPTQELLEAGARGISNVLIRHLRARNTRPSKPGWPKSNYWADAADSVSTKLGGTSALISIHAPGVRIHLKGGVIKPKKAGGALAIPARPEVAGIWPSEYSGRARVFLLVRKALGKAYLVEAEPGGHLRILWRLLPQTRHTADPTVLPSETRLSRAASEAVQSILPQDTK